MILTVYQPDRLWRGGVPERGADGKIVNWVRPHQIGTRVALDWDELATWASSPVVAATKEEAGGFSCATYRDDVRLGANVEAVDLLPLDLDANGAAEVAEALGAYRAIVYSTHSSSPDAPRCRALLALSRAVTAREYSDVWTHVEARLRGAGLEADGQAKDASRLLYLPAAKPSARFDFHALDGVPLDVEAVLALARQERARIEAELAEARASMGAAPSLRRLRSYLDRLPPAVDGQKGSTVFWRAVNVIVDNTDDDATQAALLADYSARCIPPWSAKEMRHALTRARRLADGRHRLANRRAS